MWTTHKRFEDTRGVRGPVVQTYGFRGLVQIPGKRRTQGEHHRVYDFTSGALGVNP